MRPRFEILTIALLAGLALAGCAPTSEQSPTPTPPESPAQATEGPSSDPLMVAVVTGGHAFDVPNFYRLWREIPGVDAYPQHIENFASSPEEVRDAYDVVVFYGMDQGVPQEEYPRPRCNPKAALERIVDQGQGVVILHHALLAWEKWDVWNQLTGFDNRNFRYKEGINLAVKVADTEHPANQGAADFEIVDEGYVLHGEHDGQGTVLLTVEHDDAMKEVAWARQQGDSRVFCLTLGHDNQSWANPAFQETLARGIQWCAGE